MYIYIVCPSRFSALHTDECVLFINGDLLCMYTTPTVSDKASEDEMCVLDGKNSDLDSDSDLEAVSVRGMEQLMIIIA